MVNVNNCFYKAGKRKSAVKNLRKGIGFKHVAEPLKAPRTCHCNRIIVEGNTTKSKGGLNTFTSDEEKRTLWKNHSSVGALMNSGKGNGKNKSTVPRRINASLFSEFQYSSCSYKMVLNQFALQTQRIVKSMDLVTHNTTAGFCHSMDTGYS